MSIQTQLPMGLHNSRKLHTHTHAYLKHECECVWNMWHVCAQAVPRFAKTPLSDTASKGGRVPVTTDTASHTKKEDTHTHAHTQSLWWTEYSRNILWWITLRLFLTKAADCRSDHLPLLVIAGTAELNAGKPIRNQIRASATPLDAPKHWFFHPPLQFKGDRHARLFSIKAGSASYACCEK